MKTIDNIKVNSRIELTHIEAYDSGYLKGYISCIVDDKLTDKEHETLYRIHDVENGKDFTLVSVDYGHNIGDSIIAEIENRLTEIAKQLQLSL